MKHYQCTASFVLTDLSRSTKFSTFPDVLVIHAKKFQLVNWVPAKLDIPVILPPSDILQLDQYLGKGLQSGETELPEDQAGLSISRPDLLFYLLLKTAAPSLPEFHEAALSQLEAMGFPIIRCQKALLATGNSDAEAAMNWLFAHMEDPGSCTLCLNRERLLTFPI